jgi:hypothetical protein
MYIYKLEYYGKLMYLIDKRRFKNCKQSVIFAGNKDVVAEEVPEYYTSI